MNLPKGWKSINLNQILSVEPQNGYSPNCVDEPTGRCILGLGNLTGTGLNLESAKNIPEKDEKVENFRLQYGDFLISRSNTPDKVGRVGMFNYHLDHYYYPDLMMRFRINEKAADINFIENYLSSKSTQRYFQSCAAGSSSTMVKINKEVVKDTPILLPPLPEQKAIAGLLSTWDAAIEKTEQLIKAKEKQFQWLLDELITKPSKSGKWENRTLSNLCNIVKGQQLNIEHLIEDGSYYALNGGVLPSGRTDGWNTLENTITISEGGNSCGFVSFNTEKFWAGGHCYTLLNVEENSIDVKYLFHYLKLREPKIMKLRVGSGLPNIQKKDINDYPVLFPQLRFQVGIAKILDLYGSEINLLSIILKKYKQQKCGLMQKLLNGQWRVNGFK